MKEAECLLIFPFFKTKVATGEVIKTQEVREIKIKRIRNQDKENSNHWSCTEIGFSRFSYSCRGLGFQNQSTNQQLKEKFQKDVCI